MSGRVKVLGLAVAGLTVAFVCQAWARTGVPGVPTTSSTDPNSRTVSYYVIAEKRGLDIVCSKLTTMQQVNDRVTALNSEGAATATKNAGLVKEIAELKKKLPGLKASLGLKKEETEKQQVQGEIDRIEADIKAKQAEIKEPVKVGKYGPFSKSEDADAVMTGLEQESRLAKEKAAKEAEKKKG